MTYSALLLIREVVASGEWDERLQRIQETRETMLQMLDDALLQFEVSFGWVEREKKREASR